MTRSRIRTTSLLDLIAAGREQLAKGAWSEARELFSEALTQAETPEALEGLGTATWWLDDTTETFEVRERSYRLYREREDRRSAARVATSLALDYEDLRGEMALASGWFQQAHRLLEGLDTGPEHGWLTLYEGYLALELASDTMKAKEHSAEAKVIAHALDLFDLEVLAVALEGLALVREGKIAEGMRCMDEATTAVIAGEMTDLNAIGSTCCSLIYACASVADYTRASEWCQRLMEFSRRWRLGSLLAFCRTYYGIILLWHGDWAAAEDQLATATRDFTPSRSAAAGEAIARLGEIRRRQGKRAEAEDFFGKADSHPMALFGRAALALDKSDPAAAADLIDRFLRRISPEDRAERVFAIQILVRALIALRAYDQIPALLAEVQSIASLVGTDPLLATSSLAQGLFAAAKSEHEAARRYLEDAIDLFKRTSAPFEEARARIDLAEVLQDLGRNAAAIQEAQTAIETLRGLGAVPEAKRAADLLSDLEHKRESATETPSIGGLTPREVEVLRLIAASRSNQEIAAELFLSVRTVERHISTIYEKIGASGKVARAAATAYALNRGIA